ncbi:hypothetical protein [Maribacter sp.]|uniref:hypothetical protein n=1 Tax=Maribacter sp. TaxID=1897614 RepID=UPI0025BFC362|nr:hypothetical protein [Maribacter sp.]
MDKSILILLSFILLSCSSKKEEPPKELPLIKAELIAIKENYIAGDSIVLKFKTDVAAPNIKLHLKNAFGTILLKSKLSHNFLNFYIPNNFTRKAGECHWKLIQEKTTLLKGGFSIKTTAPKGTKIETYFGPRSITAGNNDFSMLIIAPTDIYDNTVNPGTEVIIKSQFLETISELKVPTNNLIAWHNVRSTLKSGRILVTSHCNETKSKELTTIVFPSNATDFSISTSSAHDFADGNQILHLKSDIIKDKYNNVVSDGTLVTFMIKDQKGSSLFTIGTTLNGIVKARTLHPSEASNWKIQAFITGAAESSIIEVNFRTAIADYSVHFSKGNRNIDIGPFESFMKQLVPDGVLVQLDIYDSEEKFIETKKTTTKKGSSTFFISPEYLPNGNYKLVFKAAGITKEFTKKIHGY